MASEERVIVAIIKPVEGKAARLEELLQDMAKSVQANEPGALRYHLHRQLDNENPSMVVIETYKDKGAHEAHRETNEFKALFKTLQDEGVVTERPTVVASQSVGGFESR